MSLFGCKYSSGRFYILYFMSRAFLGLCPSHPRIMPSKQETDFLSCLLHNSIFGSGSRTFKKKFVCQPVEMNFG